MEEHDLKIHEEVAELKTHVSTILENHLPHIQRAIEKVDVKVDKVGEKLWWVLSTIVIGFLATLVVAYLK